MSRDERTQTAYTKLPLVLSANINPGFVHASRRYMTSETAASYAYKQSEPIGKEHHFTKDSVKEFVEKALTLHDGELLCRKLPAHSNCLRHPQILSVMFTEKAGMAVVSSPVWVNDQHTGKPGQPGSKSPKATRKLPRDT